MSMAAILTILRYFGPEWFKSIAEESRYVPATIASIALVWLTVVGTGLLIYQRLDAADLRMVSMQEVLAANTQALDCSSRDRRISAKAREIMLATRLRELATDENEIRELDAQLNKMNVEMTRMELSYSHNCLNGDV